MSSGDVVLSYDLPASPPQAFLLYVDRIGTWWPGTYTADPATYERVIIEPRVGGRVFARHRAGVEYDWGHVTELEPGKRLRHTFNLAHASRVPSVVEVNFSDLDTGTRLTFRHGGWTSANAMDRHKFGDWPLILSGYVELVRAHASGRAFG